MFSYFSGIYLIKSIISVNILDAMITSIYVISYVSYYYDESFASIVIILIDLCTQALNPSN